MDLFNINLVIIILKGVTFISTRKLEMIQYAIGEIDEEDSVN